MVADIEVYRNYFLIAFKRLYDGKVVAIEMSARTDRADDDAKRARARQILRNHRIVTFNGLGFDMPLMIYFIQGASIADLKTACNQIIEGRVKYWEVGDLLQITIPREIDHWDLIEPQPNAFASLKTLNGRLHGRHMQDLPYHPEVELTADQMEVTTAYCGNDLEATERLLYALKEPMELRAALTREYGTDFMSKSDSQIGEGIIKRVAKQKTGEWPQRPQVKAGTTFRYTPPAFLDFENPELKAILEQLGETDFVIQGNGKVDLPPWLDGLRITIGGTEFAMGIGGLHSTESNRCVRSDDEHAMVDVDVTGFYPQIIINSRMYPPAIGPAFCEIYAEIKAERDRLKPMLKAPDTPKDDLPRIKAAVEGRKIVGNGVFGKTSSPYSTIYAPHLMIYTTLTGQLSILMLIDRITAAGMQVVSANTDGVVIRFARGMWSGLEGDRFKPGHIKDVIETWERDTGFMLEAVEYDALYNQSVNTYIAVTSSGKVKRKGTLSNPWREGDIRGQLTKNPNAVVCADAVVEHLTKGVPIADYIRGCADARDFVTVVNVKGGGVWAHDPAALPPDAEVSPIQGLAEHCEFLGKVVRYYWAHGGSPIFYKDPHPTTGNFKKVPKTDGCRPLMTLPDSNAVPGDIDYERYIEEAEQILVDIGVTERIDPVKPLRIFKHSAILYAALAA
ncbi:hypothetical protein I5E68_09660 [Novosphingobium sp. YJ-S2-02]|uniref:Uncharacterized protein n=1 Tax=Novosphingobium aureum TaxID=2792964 RepID=A0A931HD32_9SPHN|nr:hypothetical protein [Novosphingobium aureum]